MKKRISILLAALLLFSTACTTPASLRASQDAHVLKCPEAPPEAESTNAAPKIMTLHGEYDYDPSNIYESVGAHSYVFAGTVEDIFGVEYPNSSTCILENGEEIEIEGNMYTKLCIKITECIKGELSVGETKQMLKLGGYDADDNAYYLCSRDTYPQLGREYIFLAEGNEDGVMIVAADCATIPLDSTGTAIASYSAETTPNRQEIIDEYIDAYAHEIPSGKTIDSTYE